MKKPNNNKKEKTAAAHGNGNSPPRCPPVTRMINSRVIYLGEAKILNPPEPIKKPAAKKPSRSAS